MRRDIRVLVIDELSEHYEHILAHAEMYHLDFNLSCKLVESKQEACAAALSWEPSVILLDAHTCGVEGLRTVQDLMQSGAPVVVMSKTKSADIEGSAMSHGAAACVTKSDNPDDLEALIELLGSVAVPAGLRH